MSRLAVGGSASTLPWVKKWTAELEHGGKVVINGTHVVGPKAATSVKFHRRTFVA